jgi:hypothetical protein
MLRQLCPELERKMFHEILTKEIDFAKKNYEVLEELSVDQSTTTEMPLEDATEVICDWTLELATKNPFLYYNIHNLIKGKTNV